MKTLLISLFIVCASIQMSAQDSFNDDFFKKDAILKSIYSVIPKGWVMSYDSSNITIYRKDSILVLYENRINAKPESAASIEERAVKHGKKELAFIRYRYDLIWDALRILDAQQNNEKIWAEIKKLPNRHGIERLKDPQRSSKERIVYAPVTHKDSMRVAAYEREYQEKLTQMIQLPNFHTQLYSLFLVEKNGLNDEYRMVYPLNVSIELSQIELLFKELCGK